MNIGVYSSKFLQLNKQKLFKFYNINNSISNLNILKTQLIYNQDLLLDRIVYLNSTQRSTSNSNDRIIQYYKDIDLYKIKGNYSGIRNTYNLTIGQNEMNIGV